MTRADEQPKTFSGADMLAGATLPVEVHLQVTLREDGDDHLHVDPKLEKKLRAGTAGVLAWVAASPMNGAALLSDPLAALEKAGLKLSRDERVQLTEALQRQGAQDVLPPGVRLASLAVRVKARGRQKPVAGGRRVDGIANDRPGGTDGKR